MHRRNVCSAVLNLLSEKRDTVKIRFSLFHLIEWPRNRYVTTQQLGLPKSFHHNNSPFSMNTLKKVKSKICLQEKEGIFGVDRAMSPREGGFKFHRPHFDRTYDIRRNFALSVAIWFTCLATHSWKGQSSESSRNAWPLAYDPRIQASHKRWTNQRPKGSWRNNDRLS